MHVSICLANNPFFIVIDRHEAGGVLAQIISQEVLMVSFSSEVFFILVFNTGACFSWPIRGDTVLSDDMRGWAIWGFPSNKLIITLTKVMLQHTPPLMKQPAMV